MERIETPTGVIELETLRRNCVHMGSRMTQLGVKLRPHVKTHKCLEIAKLQVHGHFGGITVSTMAEAEFFAANGYTDITLGVPLAPGRVDRATALGARIKKLNLLIDHEFVADRLSEKASTQSQPVSVFLKVDCGYGRAGVDPRGEQGLRLARRLHEDPHIEFCGILAHGGHAYDRVGKKALRIVAEEERSVTVAFAERLKQSGIPVLDVSIGSTPTMSVIEDLTGITEVRPGNYAFYDVFQATIGSCALTDIAFSVMTEVIGVYPERGQMLIDAGAIALSKDPGLLNAQKESEFGLVYSADGQTPLPHLRLIGLSQEHGKVKVVGHGPLPMVGERLRILPNHSCLTAAAHHSFAVMNDGKVVDTWYPIKGW